LIAFLQGLTPKRIDHLLLAILSGFTTVWILSAIFAISFQCRLPQAWNYIDGKCMDKASQLPILERQIAKWPQTAFWNYFGAMNILTDVGLIGIPVFVVSRVKTSLMRRVKVIFYFCGFRTV
jgi:hypothetical protein